MIETRLPKKAYWLATYSELERKKKASSMPATAQMAPTTAIHTPSDRVVL